VSVRSRVGLIWRGVLARYLRDAPINRGKGFIVRRLFIPSLPPGHAQFEAILPCGLTIDLEYRESLGVTMLVHGAFEAEEIRTLASLTRAGSTAFDIGANVGVFTLCLARAVGTRGQVIAAEPVAATCRRLAANVARNGLTNVHTRQLAVGSVRGIVDLSVGDDPAYAKLAGGGSRGALLSVEQVTLDDLWVEAGEPAVSVVKVDVEGSELGVVHGGLRLIRALHPALLLEANTPRQLSELNKKLTEFGYVWSRPDGFMPWNNLFLAGTR
jgi:FkbM family methyltransferase